MKCTDSAQYLLYYKEKQQMVETFVPGAIETGAQVNSLSEATEQDMVRVRESMQKAQQLGAQIRDDQKNNSHLAQFLTYLFSAVTDDEIWTMSVELFTRRDQSNISMTLAIYEMLALFLPFYTARTRESGIDNAFPTLHYEIVLTRESYLNYIKLLYRTYPMYEQLDKDTLSTLIASLLLYHRTIVLEEGQSLQTIAQLVRPSLG